MDINDAGKVMNRNRVFLATGAVILLIVGLIIYWRDGLSPERGETGSLSAMNGTSGRRNFRVQPADVVRAQSISRPNFSLKIPGNWKVDTTRKNHHPDHDFSVLSNNGNYVWFHVFNVPTNPKQNLAPQVEFQAKTLKSSSRASFTGWGRYNGQGVYLKGMATSDDKGNVRIFSASSKSRSFIVVEWFYEKNSKQDQPGFKLIESSFQLR